ncbi:hypothetical protein P7C70_g9649, partial [Phenoliferia sp. Uapishka_3]
RYTPPLHICRRAPANPHIPIHRAVDLVKANSNYTSTRINAFVHDLTAGTPALREKLSGASPDFWQFGRDGEGELKGVENDIRPDIISCVFVLSALPPGKQVEAVRSLIEVLKPGGTLLLRDYALHDEAQLRFHALPSKSYASIPSLLSPSIPTPPAPSPSSSTSPLSLQPLSDSLPSIFPAPTTSATDDTEAGKAWYRRGDSTLCYFFTVEEIEALVKQDSTGTEGVEKFRMKGEAKLIEREMENRKEGWGCKRRFVQGCWVKELVE